MPFRVTSANWQESDRLLAGLMTAFGAHQRGSGRRRRPLRRRDARRVRGRASRAASSARRCARGGDLGRRGRRLRRRKRVRQRQPRGRTRRLSRMDVTGQFSLGYPRRDGGEEIDARVRVDEPRSSTSWRRSTSRTMTWTGMVSGDFHLYGQYEQPLGFGRLAIDAGHGVRRAVRRGRGGAALRGRGSAARRPQVIVKGGGTIDRRGLPRLERHLLVQRRRPRLAVETLAVATMSRGPGLHRAPRLLGQRQRHVRGAALRREAGRARPVRTATRASARSRVGCRCATSC
jgi:hypothetical protein